jgi:hypothetical protein
VKALVTHSAAASDRRPSRRLGAAVLVALLAGCPQRVNPGDEAMGQYLIHAEMETRTCELEELSGAPFEFTASFSRVAGTVEAFVTLGDVSRPGTWDGQVLESPDSAPRVFAECRQCRTWLDENLVTALLSRSQAEKSGLKCPENTFDGGIPAPESDGGTHPPRQTELGFDAVLACGRLNVRLRGEALSSAAICPEKCQACTIAYRLDGVRR